MTLLIMVIYTVLFIERASYNFMVKRAHEARDNLFQNI